MEKRICLRNRKELVLIDPQKIVYVEADGNYVYVICLNNQKFHLNFSISEFLLVLTSNSSDHFLKIVRSLVVNILFITRIWPQKSLLLLSDGGEWTHRIELPQKTLKNLCKNLGEKFSSNNILVFSECNSALSDSI